jgi:ubiquinol-cytochrome c reductase cytochrome b subunit
MAFVLGTVVMVGTLWVAGEQAKWSPNFDAQPLPVSVVNSTDPHVINGSKLFLSKGCEYCHSIGGEGGERGPDLSQVGGRLSSNQVTTRILTGATNMPAYGAILTPAELNDLVAFLESRK